jgi:spermidine synthase
LFVLIRIGYIYTTNILARKPTPIPSQEGNRPANILFAKHIKFNCLWTIGATGFAGMALELILIFAFQNIYGYIYQKAGLIVAVFMVGLASGGYGSHIMTRRHTDSRSLPRLREPKLISYLLYVEMIVVLFSALLPVCIRSFSSPRFLHTPTLVELSFMVLVGITGLLTGMVFPLASAVYLSTQEELGKTAGMIDSADHVGAFCGSLLVGVLLIPLLGVTTSCYLISTFTLSSVVFLLLAKLGRVSS